MVISNWLRKHLIQVLSLHPELKLAWRVTGILATFKHGDYDNLDRNGGRWLWRLSAKQARNTDEKKQPGDNLHD
jgi:hypothetical protein